MEVKKIRYFFRKTGPGTFSIEGIFHTLADYISEKGMMNVEKRNVPFFSKGFRIIQNILYARRNQGEINHITGDVHYTILGLSDRNLNFLTVHDIGLLNRLPKYSPKYRLYLWLWVKWPVKKARLVTVVSEKTKRDILAYVDCPPEKIRVIPNFVQPVFSFSPQPFHTQSPIILQVGAGPNKNLERVAAALSGLSCRLHIIGEPTPRQEKVLRGNGVEYEVFSNLTPVEIAERYRLCDMVIFVSTFEGFGLPVLEAQASGRPLVTSDIDPIAGIAGDGACLVDPLNVMDIRRGILQVIHDENYRKSILEKGLENAERYSLDRIAQQYLETYNQII